MDHFDSMFFKGEAIPFTVVDVQSIKADGSPQAIKTFTLNSAPPVRHCALSITGGGMGGIAAALAYLQTKTKDQKKKTLILSEETAWLGGQMTSQGVSALDENKWIELSGGCKSYLDLRRRIRAGYAAIAKTEYANPLLHPGRSWVTRLSFEPQKALAVLEEDIAPHIGAGALHVLKKHKAVAARKDGDKVEALLLVDLDSGKFTEIRAEIFIDATELGDLFPLANIAYRTGSDPQSLTKEKHAPRTGNPENVQDYVYPFVVRLRPGEKHVIDKPDSYEQFQAAGQFSLNNFKMFQEYDGEEADKPRHYLPFWTYRRLIDCALFRENDYPYDISMINWDSNDLRGHNILDKTPEQVVEHLALAKQLSLGFLYWLQTEAPRDEGGFGYPEFELAKDVLGTSDGLSMHPYIREARRLDALYTIVEEDIVNPQKSVRESEIFEEVEARRARHFHDSVGIGHYPVDIHGEKEVEGTAQPTRPFQLPAGALVPKTCSNLLAASKNIGVSHITNGSYRLHPVEWAIGTASGVIAALAIAEREIEELAIGEHAIAGRAIEESVDLQNFVQDELVLLRLQIALVHMGAPIYWFDDISPERVSFAAIQIAAQQGLVETETESLSFEPQRTVGEAEVLYGEQRLLALCKRLGLQEPSLELDEQPSTREEFALYLYARLINSVGKSVCL